MPAEPPHLDFYSQVETVLFGKDRVDNLRTLSKLILNRQRLGPINLSDRLTPGQAVQAKEILEEWIRLKNKVGDVGPSVQKILSFIGFVVRELRRLPDISKSGRWFELEAEPIESRNDCILPDFGSRCQGRYSILCLEGQPLEDEILPHSKRRASNATLDRVLLRSDVEPSQARPYTRTTSTPQKVARIRRHLAAIPLPSETATASLLQCGQRILRIRAVHNYGIADTSGNVFRPRERD